MSAKRLAAAAARLQRRAGGPLDVAIVCGSGLSEGIRERIAGREVPYEKLDAPRTTVAGHANVAYAGVWCEKRVAAFAGRAHLYEGYGPSDVTYLVRLAAAANAKTLVLTSAAGGLNAGYAAGDLMLLADHINLSGATLAMDAPGEAFVDMTDAYAPRLRALARQRRGGSLLREGVYAGVRGPQYETAAEAQALRRLGADAVGMSMVMETIAARRAGLAVLGISLIANVVRPGAPVSHENVLRAARVGGTRIADVIEGVIASL